MKKQKINIWKFVSAGLAVMLAFLLLFKVDVNFRFAGGLTKQQDSNIEDVLTQVPEKQLIEQELITPAKGVVLAAIQPKNSGAGGGGCRV